MAKPRPIVDVHNRPYFEAAAQGVLRIQRCQACERNIFFPRVACPSCLGPLEWRDASGRGSVYSFAVIHVPHDAAFLPEVPMIMAAIKLEEGPVVISELRGARSSDVVIGMPVVVEFTLLDAELTLPTWRLAPRPS